MTIDVQRYAKIDELVDRLQVGRAASEFKLDAILGRASTAVERHCHRRFTLDAAASARVFRPIAGDLVSVDDIADTTGIAVATGTDGTYVSDVTTDVWYGPDNAPAEAEPYTEVLSDGIFPMSLRRPTVQVTAIWGWPEVPENVTEATLLYAARLWSRRTSPSGVLNVTDSAGAARISSVDADVVKLLDDFVRSVF